MPAAAVFVVFVEMVFPCKTISTTLKIVCLYEPCRVSTASVQYQRSSIVGHLHRDGINITLEWCAKVEDLLAQQG
jgi:hypothetical protein